MERGIMTMHDVYRVFHNQRAQSEDHEPVIEGVRQWKLPSLRCLSCGMVRGLTSVIYPWIDPSSLPNRRIYKGNRVCALEPDEWKLAAEPIRRMLPEDHILPPGTSLGGFKGRHRSGDLEDFHLYFQERLVARPVYERLRSQGALRNLATSALIKGRKGFNLDFVELHLVPRARLAVSMVQLPGERYCPDCGFDQRSLPEPLVIRAETIPTNEDVFQLVERPFVKLATERFVAEVDKLQLTGIEFEAVQTV